MIQTINSKRKLFDIGIILATKKKPYTYNNSNKTLHITYAEWDDLLSIFRTFPTKGETTLVFQVHMGEIKKYKEDFFSWQKILKDEYRKKYKK